VQEPEWRLAAICRKKTWNSSVVSNVSLNQAPSSALYYAINPNTANLTSGAYSEGALAARWPRTAAAGIAWPLRGLLLIGDLVYK
jgi:hypothetical protein